MVYFFTVIEVGHIIDKQLFRLGNILKSYDGHSHINETTIRQFQPLRVVLSKGVRQRGPAKYNEPRVLDDIIENTFFWKRFQKTEEKPYKVKRNIWPNARNHG